MVENKIYQNKNNANKFISMKHYSDGHYSMMQYMFWDNGVKNPIGCGIRSKGKHFRHRKSSVDEILNDYNEVSQEAIK